MCCSAFWLCRASSSCRPAVAVRFRFVNMHSQLVVLGAHSRLLIVVLGIFAQLGLYALHFLIILAIIVAVNFSYTQFRAVLNDVGWTADVSLQYLQMKQYQYVDLNSNLCWNCSSSRLIFGFCVEQNAAVCSVLLPALSPDCIHYPSKPPVARAR